MWESPNSVASEQGCECFDNSIKTQQVGVSVLPNPTGDCYEIRNAFCQILVNGKFFVGSRIMRSVTQGIFDCGDRAVADSVRVHEKNFCFGKFFLSRFARDNYVVLGIFYNIFLTHYLRFFQGCLPVVGAVIIDINEGDFLHLFESQGGGVFDIFEIRLCCFDSPLCCFYLHGAIVGERGQASNFVECAKFEIGKSFIGDIYFFSCFEYFFERICRRGAEKLACFRYVDHGAFSVHVRSCKTWFYSRSGELGRCGGIFSLLTPSARCDIEGNCSCGHSSHSDDRINDNASCINVHSFGSPWKRPCRLQCCSRSAWCGWLRALFSANDWTPHGNANAVGQHEYAQLRQCGIAIHSLPRCLLSSDRSTSAVGRFVKTWRVGQYEISLSRDLMENVWGQSGRVCCRRVHFWQFGYYDFIVRSRLWMIVASCNHASPCEFNCTATRICIHFDINVDAFVLACFYRTGEKTLGFEKGRIYNMKHSKYFFWTRSQSEPQILARQEMTCYVHTVLSSSNLHCAIVRKGLQTSNLFDRASRRCGKYLQLISKVGGQIIRVDGFSNPHTHPYDLVTKGCEAVDNGACRYAGGDERFSGTSASLRGCNIERGHNGAAGTYCGRDVPEIFFGMERTRNRRPYTKQSEEADCNQQPDERQLRDVPRAFHVAPVFDYAGIVARCWALLWIRCRCVGAGPFLHRDAFLHPRRINVTSRFV